MSEGATAKVNSLSPDAIRQVLPEADQLLKFDDRLTQSGSPVSADQRFHLYSVLADALNRGPTDSSSGAQTGLCLGHIQSGKTTAMTALCALAADSGYSAIVAVLGSTNLLLGQNTSRLKDGLGMGDALKSDYAWVHLDAADLRRGSAQKIQDALGSERTLLITVLKNSRRIATLASVFSQVDLSGRRVLVLDDEADQASLNTMVATEAESATYRELGRLCDAFGPKRLYFQFTATPYAPLLLDPDDTMAPEFVTILTPGAGYTGARAFFIDNSEMVVRRISASETPKSPPRVLPLGLRNALASFVAGAALLLGEDDSQAPVSMLVHPTSRVAVHDRTATLIARCIRSWRSELQTDGPPVELSTALQDLVEQSAGAIDPPDPDNFAASAERALRLAEVSVVNGQAAADKVDWAKSPVHILVGGNKLDRGFTVEGLTVTYMSRRHSPQLDTLVQRARAFGYRSEYLPYCRFYATQETIDGFAASVLTDELLRNELKAWTAAGRDLEDWPARAGFLLSDGIRPTRKSVAPWLATARHDGWSIASHPSLDSSDIQRNRSIIDDLGLPRARHRDYGRLTHRTLTGVGLAEIVNLVTDFDQDGPAQWRRNGLVDYLQRVVQELDLSIPVLLLEGTTADTPRRRKWIDGVGYSNLMQGRDKYPDEAGAFYPGDRELLEGTSHLQVHHLQHPHISDESLYTLALRVGNEFPVTKEVRRQ